MTERPPQADNADPLWKRWQEVDRLFDRALDIPEPGREAFLREQCRGDTELFTLVADLLSLTNAEDTPVDRKPSATLLRAATSRTDGDTSIEPGTRIGHYRVVAELGRGGMATVYEAERADGSFQRRVAIKVLRRGIDTDDVVRRFLAERQILSDLTHRNIARLLDGGATDDGLPYLVMDRVDGEPITHWADRQRLTIRQRLELFVQVADAVHYAHQRLIVHRDLKPSNILVTTDGVVNLLDFGIAKILSAEADDALTGLGPRPITPQYASPEQLRGEMVTTRSDVYQLGILLHVLLIGSRPRARSAPSRRADTDFTRPSSVVRPAPPEELETDAGTSWIETVASARRTTPEELRRALRGDLDTIILEALQHEPSLRYDSASAMAEDVRRHLGGHPIAARPASLGYRFGRFVQRNRWFPPALALAVVAAAAIGVNQVRHARQLERERNEARAQADRANQLRGFLINLFGSADPYTPADSLAGRDITVVEALEVGADRARADLADRPALLADLLSAIARVHENLDQRNAALELLDEALTIRESTEDSLSSAYLDDVGRRAALLGLLGRTDAANAAKLRRLGLEQKVFGEEHPRAADAMIPLSSVAYEAGDFERALELTTDAVRILRAAGPSHRKLLGDALGFQADALRSVNRRTESEAAARESLEIQRELFGDENPTTALARIHLAQVLHAIGRIDESLEVYEEALPVLDRTLGPDHFNTLRSWNNYGIVVSSAGDDVRAERVHRRILESRRRVEGTDTAADVVSSIQNLAAVVLRQRRFAEAESLAIHAAGLYDAILPEGHYLRAFPLLTVSESRLARGEHRGAEQSARAALEILDAALPDHYATAVARCRLGAAIAAGGGRSDAEPLIRTAMAQLDALEGVPDRLVDECRSAIEDFERTTG